MSSSVTAYSDIPKSEDFLGHPKGVFVCFFTEMWERFSFYGMKALLLLYLLKHHGFDDDGGYELIGTYGGLVYAVPVIGGPARRPLARDAQGGRAGRRVVVPRPPGHGGRRPCGAGA
jgi:hypothetical protein